MLVDIVAVSVLEGYRLKLLFEDGTQGEFNVADAIGFSGVFERLRDPGHFAQVTVNPSSGLSCGPMARIWTPLYFTQKSRVARCESHSDTAFEGVRRPPPGGRAR
jgi:hypothetical protein